MSSLLDSQKTAVDEAPLPPNQSRRDGAITPTRTSTSAPAPTPSSTRKRNHDNLETDLRGTGSQTPRPPSKRWKGSPHAFAGKAFITTTHPESNNYTRKGQFRQDLEHGGGLVKEGWENLFKIALHKRSDGKKRWLETTRADVSWIEWEGIREVLLIADSPTQTQKYLIALALGIPCVSFGWIDDVHDSPTVRLIIHSSLRLTDGIVPTVRTRLAIVPTFSRQIHPIRNALLAVHRPKMGNRRGAPPRHYG